MPASVLPAPIPAEEEAAPAGSARVQGGAAYHVRRFAAWPEAASWWARAAEPDWGAATPFQNPRWLAAWYAAHRRRRDVEPLILAATEAGTGAPAVLLPLVRRRVGAVRVITFADLDLTDYNAPLLGPAAPTDRTGAGRLWRTTRRAMPGDLVRLAKMPPTLGDRPNPLALLPGAAPCPLTGNVVAIGNSLEEHLRTLPKAVRKELGRSWRVFERHPGARFRQITDPVEGASILATMEAQQRRRMRETGQAYALDEPAAAEFYRLLVAGIAEGEVVLTALQAESEVVAALLGLRRADLYVMIRISHAGGEGWAPCSPGRLVIDRTMALLHADGCRRFDFSIGDYAYKRRFGAAPTSLVDVHAALTPVGWPGLARARAAVRLRRHPHLDALARRLLGLLPHREVA